MHYASVWCCWFQAAPALVGKKQYVISTPARRAGVALTAPEKSVQSQAQLSVMRFHPIIIIKITHYQMAWMCVSEINTVCKKRNHLREKVYLRYWDREGFVHYSSLPPGGEFHTYHAIMSPIKYWIRADETCFEVRSLFRWTDGCYLLEMKPGPAETNSHRLCVFPVCCGCFIDTITHIIMQHIHSSPRSIPMMPLCSNCLLR